MKEYGSSSSGSIRHQTELCCVDEGGPFFIEFFHQMKGILLGPEGIEASI